MERIWAFNDRGLPVSMQITTDVNAADLSSITFVVEAVTKAGLTATDTSYGVDIDVTLTAVEMDMMSGSHRWECYGTLNGEVTTLLYGIMHVSPAWT